MDIFEACRKGDIKKVKDLIEAGETFDIIQQKTKASSGTVSLLAGVSDSKNSVLKMSIKLN